MFYFLAFSVCEKETSPAGLKHFERHVDSDAVAYWADHISKAT